MTYISLRVLCKNNCSGKMIMSVHGDDDDIDDYDDDDIDGSIS